MTFTFDPAQINDGGLNQVRFDLGDCLITEPEKSAYLTDEEIIAALENRTLKRAELFLIDSLLARFAYEVDTKVDEVEWKLHQRIDAWQKLRKRLADELAAEEIGNSFGAVTKKFRPPCFKIGLNDFQ